LATGFEEILKRVLVSKRSFHIRHNLTKVSQMMDVCGQCDVSDESFSITSWNNVHTCVVFRFHELVLYVSLDVASLKTILNRSHIYTASDHVTVDDS
jgi:hypothetical protein